MRYAMTITAVMATTLLGGCVYIASDEENTSRPHRMQTEQAAPHGEHAEHMQRHKRAVVESDASFAVTRVRLRNAITTRGLTLFDEIDHQANADGIGLEMGPSTVFIFGNPTIGSKLMNANPQFGLDLPMRALVYETDAGVFVTSVNITRMMDHNHLEGMTELRGNVTNALSGIVADATGSAN